jgi:hypothetical protein
MNLPLGRLESDEEWEHARPIDYLSKVDLNLSGVIRFFERGKEWNVFFLLIEEGSLIGYYIIKGDTPLEEKLYSEIQKCEVEIRSFSSSEMRIARDINAEYMLTDPIVLSELRKELRPGVESKNPLLDQSLLVEIKKARKFREDFLRRRTVDV